MKVRGLDGRTYNMNLKNNARKKCSEPHSQARNLLKEEFPCYEILEEIPLPGSGQLTVDFFLPQLSLMVEVQGRQHDEFVPFFHGSKDKFAKSMKRDNRKKQWCDLNDIELVELLVSETEDEWRDKVHEY